MKLDAYGILGAALLLVLFLLGFALLDLSQSDARKVARQGVLLALALVLGLLESFLPDVLLPGMRLGLANIALLLVLYVYGAREGFVVAVLKAVLGSMLRGSMFSMGGLMALTGTMAAFIGMALLHALWKKCSPIGVSVFGALLHVSGQMLIAYFYLGVAVLGYWPWLLLVSVLTGTVTGLVALLLLRNKALMRYLRP